MALGTTECSITGSATDGTEAIANSISTGGVLPHLARNELGAGFDGPESWWAVR